MVKKTGVILLLLLAAQYGGRPQGAAPTIVTGLAFADSYTQDGKPCPPECVSDSMEIITYYPSPYGYYEELRGDKIIVGDTDNSHIDETHLPPSGTITFEPVSYASVATGTNLYEGIMYYDKDDHKFRYYDNTGSDSTKYWKDLGGGDYWKPSTADTNDIYYTRSGNVGIGVGESDTIGAKLQINTSSGTKGLVVKAAIDNFLYTGAPQTYVVPLGVTSLTIEAYGAQGSGIGGYTVGGLGGRANATFTVTPGEVLYIYVGSGGGGEYFRAGYNGGGAGGAGGGGASDVRRGGTALTNRIIVAGGGGGGGYWSGDNEGGVGGGTSGAMGGGVCRGGGGTQVAGGASGCSGSPGAIATGGGGDYSSGGGGGGFYGGGGGGYDNGRAGGGGGGSSYVTGTNTSTQAGVNVGNGKVIINPVSAGVENGNIIEWQDSSGTVMNVVDINGNLALGSSTANGYKLYVNGSAYTTGSTWATSDLRFKNNILPLNNSLDKILNIQPVSFDWNKDEFPDMNFDSSRQIGLVAQEVEKQIPELVRTDTDGYKSIAYDKLTVVTIEAIKEQQKDIEELKAMLKETFRKQQKEIELLKAGKEIRE